MKTVDERKVDVATFLFEKGFIHYGNHSTKDAALFQKKIAGTNHSINVWEYDHTIREHRLYSYEVEMCFETDGEHWVNIKYYSISAEDLIAQVESFSKQLYACVKILGGNPRDYRLTGD